MADNFSYEIALNRIKDILKKMESNDISLQETMSLFKEAKNLIAKCDKYLAEMEGEFEIIIADGQDDLQSEEDEMND